MPSPDKTRNKSRLYLILLALVFVGPIVASYMLYHFRSYAPEVLSNGHLIMPPLDVRQLSLYNNNGEQVSIKAFEGDWVMLFIEPKKCYKACLDTLYKMRQIRTRLGKNQDRVKRVIVTLKGQRDPALREYLQSPYQGTLHLKTTKSALQLFLAKLPSKSQALENGYLYLVDPLGNLMMSYKPSQKPKGIYTDMKRLLRASQIG